MDRRTEMAGISAARSWRNWVLVMAAFALFGCGMLPPQRLIRDIESIAGMWEGNLTYHESFFGTTQVGATWTIHRDGTFEMVTNRARAKGTLKIDHGNLLFFDGPRASGFATLHEGPDERLLLSAGNEPGTSGVWSPVK
ncbi:MAG: hypothetical protein ACE5JS_07195 [Nitrospinota bacterium]